MFFFVKINILQKIFYTKIIEGINVTIRHAPRFFKNDFIILFNKEKLGQNFCVKTKYQ